MINAIKNMNYEQGRFSGFWEACGDREPYAEEYVTEMQSYARAYGIPFKEQPEENYAEEEWEWLTKCGREYGLEDFAFGLKVKTEEKIFELIQKELEEIR